MKSKVKIVIAAIILVTGTQPVYARNSCASVLCLYGVFRGEGIVDNCSSPVTDYFKIVKFRLDGSFSPSKTKKARGKYLRSCSGSTDQVNKINDKFGRLFDSPI